MDEKKDGALQASASQWKAPSFDATTNFSLLGWILAMLFRRPDTEKQIDFTLKE